MSRCWTCGTKVNGYRYTCNNCENLKEIRSIGINIENMVTMQAEGFAAIRDRLSEIVSVLEWGFGEINWRLQQQTDVLMSIDHTLKTPSETRANEWRLHAEELRRRGVLEESEEFFLKALNEYRLDYRIYIGLAETYLQMNSFDKAKAQLEKSLPHAPQKEINYKSYSHRLIGHIYACEENFNDALNSLHSAIKLSPNYADALYDFAQYSSLVSDEVVDRICSHTFQEWGKNWSLKDYNLVRFLCLQKAIEDKPVYFYLAEKEKNFNDRRSTVQLALKNLSENAHGRVDTIIYNIEATSPEVENAISEAENALITSRDKSELKSIQLFKNSEQQLLLVKDKIASGDYISLLGAQPLAEETLRLLNEARDLARKEQEHFEKRRSEKVANAWSGVPKFIFGVPLLSGFIGGMAGCTIALASFGDHGHNWSEGFNYGFILAGLIGFFVGIYIIQKELN